MSGTIVNLSAFSSMPLATVAADFGLKTAGVVRLLKEQPGVKSPYRYEVPCGSAIKVDRFQDISDAELKGALDALSAGIKHDGAVLVRSSSVEEKPGQKKTDFVHVDAHDPLATFRRFREAVSRVCESSNGMGALVMPLVSGPIHHFQGDGMLGLHNVSFVADTHAASNDHEMYISLVSGLGTRAVNADTNSILVTVERESGRITSFVNRSERAALMHDGGRWPVTKPVDYRQDFIDFFSLRTGRVAVMSFTDAAFDLTDEYGSFQRPELMIDRGALCFFNRGKSSYHEGMAVPEGVQFLGFTPFTTPAPLMHLIGVLRFLASKSDGPIQVEGAFLSPSENVPYLYQCIDVPPSPFSDIEVSREGADGYSQHVIGTCDVRAPLIALEKDAVLGQRDPHILSKLRRMDERFRKTGYALLALKHTSQIIELTPHCRVRLSLWPENMASHAATYARILQVSNPGGGAVLASQVKLSDALEALFRERTSEAMVGNAQLLVSRTYIRSNGRELSLHIDHRNMPEEEAGSLEKKRAIVASLSPSSFIRWLRSIFTR